jgi:hypothetical protein
VTIWAIGGDVSASRSISEGLNVAAVRLSLLSGYLFFAFGLIRIGARQTVPSQPLNVSAGDKDKDKERDEKKERPPSGRKGTVATFSFLVSLPI